MPSSSFLLSNCVDQLKGNIFYRKFYLHVERKRCQVTARIYQAFDSVSLPTMFEVAVLNTPPRSYLNARRSLYMVPLNSFNYAHHRRCCERVCDLYLYVRMTDVFCAVPGRYLSAKENLGERNQNARHPVTIDIQSHDDAVEERFYDSHVAIETQRYK